MYRAALFIASNCINNHRGDAGEGRGSQSFPLLSGVSISKQWLHTPHMLPQDFNLGSLREMPPFKLRGEQRSREQKTDQGSEELCPQRPEDTSGAVPSDTKGLSLTGSSSKLLGTLVGWCADRVCDSLASQV